MPLYPTFLIAARPEDMILSSTTLKSGKDKLISGGSIFILLRFASSNNLTTYCSLNKRYDANGVLAIGCIAHSVVAMD